MALPTFIAIIIIRSPKLLVDGVVPPRQLAIGYAHDVCLLWVNKVRDVP